MRWKRMLVMLLVSGLVFGGVFGFVAFRDQMIKDFFANMPVPVVPVTAEPAQAQGWEVTVPAIGTLRAVSGIEVAAQVPGLVQDITFQSGQTVTKGQVLLRLDADVEKAQLRSAQAQLELARANAQRARTLARSAAGTEASLDKAESELRIAQASIEQLKAQIDKKVVTAPFDGVLGVRKVDLGAYIEPGTPIVTLQDLSVMLVDFAVPQKELARVRVGQPVRLTTDAWPGRVFAGRVAALEPLIQAKSGMVTVQASLANPDGALRPGLFASLEVVQGDSVPVVTVPQSAITYNLYGDSVFVVHEGADGNRDVSRAVVDVGERRDGRVAILSGLRPGDMVVTSGQVKLENGSRVQVADKENPLKAPDKVAVE